MAEELEVYEQAARVMRELLDRSKICPGEIVVVGCSTSEVLGHQIGTTSSMEVAGALYDAIASQVRERGCYLAAQCCEHLNRALILEEEAARRYGYDPVWVVPQPKAGGSFATTAWRKMQHPVAVERIRAACGLDIGGTLIGMHLREVAVPLRLSVQTIGNAPILCAYTRPKYIGGPRACYEE
jgi:uncharacterized protein (TIGR01440 family)